jgi:cyclopropane-fatty-acyl-phospholipid synthase
MRASDLAAGEAFMRGDIEVQGDLERAIAALGGAAAARHPKEWATIGWLIAKLPRITSTGSLSRSPARLRGRRHSPDRDHRAIAYHYNLSNEFFALFLDESLAYSCAYFQDGTETVEQAQSLKHDLICRKLRLRQGDRLLDVGCGWGGLVRFAAREYGALVTGVTTSEWQAEYNRQRITREGLGDRCRIAVADYRRMSELGLFDKATSVEMVEHVGDEMMALYFQCVFERLRPGGLFLNQFMTAYEPPRSPFRALADRLLGNQSAFTEAYVFPDGKMPRLPQMTQAALAAGFELRDVENLREHYVHTLRCWIRRLESREAEARALVGAQTYNVFRLWLAGSAYSFVSGRLGVVQVLLAKWKDGAVAQVPHTRTDIGSKLSSQIAPMP